MLTAKDNELLTRVGPGTPMGALLRQNYWVPALRAGMRDPDACVRRVSGSFLGRVSHPSATEALLAGLDDASAAPRIWYVGPALNAPSALSVPIHAPVADRSAVTAIVDRIAAAGGTAVKIHDRLSRETYTQIAEAARHAMTDPMNPPQKTKPALLTTALTSCIRIA